MAILELFSSFYWQPLTHVYLSYLQISKWTCLHYGKTFQASKVIFHLRKKVFKAYFNLKRSKKYMFINKPNGDIVVIIFWDNYKFSFEMLQLISIKYLKFYDFIHELVRTWNIATLNSKNSLTGPLCNNQAIYDRDVLI